MYVQLRRLSAKKTYAMTQGWRWIWSNYKKRARLNSVFWRTGMSTVSRFIASTSIIPLRRFWQSGGTKCGMWNMPLLTFSSNWRRLSSSNGKAPCHQKVINKMNKQIIWDYKTKRLFLRGNTPLAEHTESPHSSKRQLCDHHIFHPNKMKL